MRLLFSPALFCLAVLMLCMAFGSCTLPDRTNGPQEPKSEVYETAKEQRGLRLQCDSAAIHPPAKISVVLTLTDDHGEPITDLTCRNFILTEDSSNISPDESVFRVQAYPQSLHLSTMLLLDLSGSMSGANFDTLKIAAHAFTRRFFQNAQRANVSMALYWFDGAAQINMLTDFSSDTLHLQRAIAALNPGLSTDRATNLHGAIIRGLELIKTEIKRKRLGVASHGALVVFTDGKDSASRVTAQRAQSAIDTCGANVSVYALGLGREVDSARLRAFGKNGFALAENFGQLEQNFAATAARIQRRLRNRYLLEYCTPKRDGRHTLKITAVTPADSAIYGAVTLSFPAHGFVGGCMLESACAN